MGCPACRDPGLVMPVARPRQGDPRKAKTPFGRGKRPPKRRLPLFREDRTSACSMLCPCPNRASGSTRARRGQWAWQPCEHPARRQWKTSLSAGNGIPRGCASFAEDAPQGTVGAALDRRRDHCRSRTSPTLFPSSTNWILPKPVVTSSLRSEIAISSDEGRLE